MPYNTILFDWDGTIADSTACIVRSVQETFRHYELDVPEPADITQHIGLPLTDFFPHLGGEKYATYHPEEVIAHYRVIYEQLAPDNTHMFDGMRELLDRLKNEQKTMGIASSKIRPVLHFSADILGVRNYFASYIGFDCVENGKPHPETIHAALNDLGLEHSDDIIVIGDATGDIEMGKGAGVKTCAVTWGAHDKEKLLASGPDYVVHNIAELEEILFRAQD